MGSLDIPKLTDQSQMKCKHCGRPVTRISGYNVWRHEDTELLFCGPPPLDLKAFPSEEGLGVTSISGLALYSVISRVEDEVYKFVKMGNNHWVQIEGGYNISVEDEYFIGRMIEFHAIGVHK